MAKRSGIKETISITVLFVITALTAIILGKLFWNPGDRSTLLFAYGILVTSAILLLFTVRYFRYNDPYQKAVRNMPVLTHKPFVSCMVAVYNEEKFIDRCLGSLISQSYNPKEIIVVNDASTDDTAEKLQKYADHPDVTVIHLEENVGKKKALAQAMLVAQGDIFAFTDSDSVWEKDAIEKCVYIFEHDKDVGAISGYTRAENWQENLLTRMQDSWYEGQFAIRKAFESAYGAVTCVSGPLAVFRKKAIFNYVPAWTDDTFLGEEFKFATDRTMTAFLLGSTYVGEKLKEKYKDSPFIQREEYPLKEWKVVYTDAARAWTIVPNTWKRFLKQQIRWKKSFIRNTFFTGTFFWKKPFMVALIFYLHVLFVVVGPLIVFRHLIYLPTKGNLFTALLYLSGILFIGFLFALDYKRRNKDDSRWIYRPLMSIFSTLVLSWLIFYSALTIKDKTWSRK